MRIRLYKTAVTITVAGLLFLLIGCQPFDSMYGNQIRFSCVSGSVDTRAYYGDLSDDGNMQQIVWQTGDVVKIMSDQAQTETTSPQKTWNYVLKHLREEGASSFASIAAENDNGLRWEDNGKKYSFWAVYPSGTTINDDGQIIGNTENGILLVAHVSNLDYSKDGIVQLRFFPAFTALQFDITCTVPGVKITKCSITSNNGVPTGEMGEMKLSPITGEFSAYIKDTTNPALGPNGVLVSNTNTKDDNYQHIERGAKSQITDDGKEIENGKSFLFICFPENIDVTLKCMFTKDGRTLSKSIDFSKYYENGLAACKKHIFKMKLDSSSTEPPTEPDDFDLIFEKVETMGQEIGGTIGSGDWAQKW